MCNARPGPRQLLLFPMRCRTPYTYLRGRCRKLLICDPPQGRRRAVGSAGHRELAILEQLGGLAGDAQLAGRLADALVALLTQAGGQCARIVPRVYDVVVVVRL